ncbi:MAG: hypothetical protein ABIT71_08660 [Vicinamibacteraceae bacterium]
MTQPKQTGAVGAPAADPRSTYVTGLYNTPESANRAYEELRGTHGYAAEDIDVVMSDVTRDRYVEAGGTTLKVEEGNKAATGLATGGAIGGGVGAALAAIFAVGASIVVPGVGLVIAGPIAAALAGAGAGAATGGIIGALVGAGIPEDRAMVYEKGLKEGGIVVGAHARDDAHAAALEQDFETYGGTGVRR